MLVAAVSLVAFPIGILITMFGALASPVAIALAGIIALGAVFTYWYDSANPIIDVLSRIGSEIYKSVGAIWELVMGANSSADAFDLMFWGLSKIGDVISIVLTPLAGMLRILRGILETVAALADFNLSSAWGPITGTGSDLGDIIGQGFDAQKNLLGFGDNSKETATTAASQKAANSNVNLGGKIQVEAVPGSKVNSASINLPTGNNLAFTK